MLTNQLIIGDSTEVMKNFEDGSIDLIITSPPYWDAVEYETGKGAWNSYESYLEKMMDIWTQCERVLRPNGKLCINTPIMPIPKKIIKNQHTRHIKNISFDMEHMILQRTSLLRYSLFIWQKQTSKLMFGSYPYPGNLLENNTTEFINVYVKPGKPPKFSKEQKEANKLSRAEWVDLTQQIWFMYPENVRRDKDHPAPFPSKLPGRLMRLYSYGCSENHEGEIILDPFVGTGTTCLVADLMGRRYIGIDQSEKYINLAKKRIEEADMEPPLLLVGTAKYPTKSDLIQIQENDLESSGKKAESKHKRKTYGRGVEKKSKEQMTLFEP